MRTVSDTDAVRLYFLDEEGGSATTLLYGTMAEAIARAAAEPEEVQDSLHLQTRDDVVAWRDFAGG